MKRLVLMLGLVVACTSALFAAGKTIDQTAIGQQSANNKSALDRELQRQALETQIFAAKSQGTIPQALLAEYEQLLNDLGRLNPQHGALDQGGDNCTDAVDLGSALGSGIASGSTANAQNDFLHYAQQPPCYQGTYFGASATAPDVTYKWTAPRTSTYTFALCGSGYDTELSLWNYTCPTHPSFPADYICGNDDALQAYTCESSGLHSVVGCIALNAGQEILVVVDGYNASSGLYFLSIFDCDPVCHDVTITAPGAYSGTTCEQGNNCEAFGSEDLVIAVEIPSAGMWSFAYNGVGFDPYLRIGYECCTSDICSDDDGGGGLNSLCRCVSLQPGTVYVTLEGLGNSCGEFQLTVTTDDCVAGRCCYTTPFGGPACSTTRFEECVTLGGVWDEGLSCEENPCGVGRCCYYDDGEPVCESGVREDFCQFVLGGVWTEGASCNTPCPATGDCGPIDLVFAVDVTGSMFQAIDNIVNELPNIIAIANTASNGDLRLGLVTFDDAVFVHHALTNNIAAVQATIAGLTSAGGFGLPEASDEALREILTGDGQCVSLGDFNVAFRAGANKIVVLITDASNGGCDDTHTPADVAYANQRALDAQAAGVRICPVWRPLPSAEPFGIIIPVLQNYAATSGGTFSIIGFDGSGAGGAINQIVANCGQGELRLFSPGIDLRCDPNGGGITTPTFDLLVRVGNSGTETCENVMLELTSIGGDAGTVVLNSANPVALGNLLAGQSVDQLFNLTVTPDADGGQIVITATVTSDNCPSNFLQIVIDVPDCDGDCEGDSEIHFYEIDFRVPPDCICAYLCVGHPVHVYVCGEGFSPGRYPLLNIAPGCMTDGCAEECEPAQWMFSNTGWTLIGDSCWHNVIIPGTDGCICVCFDRFLPAELASFSALPGNEEIQIRWTTASETQNDHFELLRDGAVTAHVAATNSPSGSSYSFVDRGLTNGRVYTYELVSVSLTGVREVIGSLESAPQAGAAVVSELALFQNYPNPFNPETSISFDLVENSSVKLSVYNPVGQLVATLVEGSLNSGRHTVQFNAAGLPSGLYFYRLTVGETVMQKKMLLLK